MNRININLGDRSYPIYIAADFCGIAKCITACCQGSRLAVITDTNVDGLHADSLIQELEAAGYTPFKHTLEAGEGNKTLEAVSDIYSFLVKNRFDRGSAVIALGGGVVGDITGFAAATYLRGINFIQVPTTLIAQSDSSVGGKTGVDFEGHKNAIGAFYQPRLVYINVNSLKTLPERELRSGLAEVVKHGLIRDSEFFSYVIDNIEKILAFDEIALQYLTKTNCSIKGSVVQEDEKENGLRAILNFGHTIGHAVESASEFKLLHGECVSIGMVGAYKLANRLGICDKSLTAKVEAALVRIGLPTFFKGLNTEEIYNHMLNDKKNRNNKFNFILPRSIGEVVNITIDDKELIKGVLEDLKKD